MSDLNHESVEDSLEIMECKPVIKPEPSTVTLKDDKKYIQLKTVSGISLFEEFLNKCMEVVKPADDIKRGVEKIRKRFEEVDSSYRDSSPFVTFLQKVIPKVPTEPWQSMKSVADLLKDHSVKKMEKQPTNVTAVVCDEPAYVMDKKTKRFLGKLQFTLEKLKNKIQSLEEKEVNFDDSDEENSNYIQVSRYKKRYCEVMNKVRELKKETEEENSTNVIRFSGTRIPSVNRAIERFYNDKKEFPDFHDILKVVLVVNDRKNLGLSQVQVHETAKTAFEELGQTLKLRRQYDFHDIMCTYLLPEENDPAMTDDTLEQKLDENKRLYGHKIDEIINKYAIQQEKDQIEPVEVGSGEESTVSESEEEEDEDEDEDDDDNESAMSFNECADLPESSRESDRENDSDVEILSDDDDDNDKERALRACSVKLHDVTKLPVWGAYQKRYTSQVPEELSDTPGSNDPCCSKSLISHTTSRKRRGSETDSEDSDASEPKKGRVLVCKRLVSSIFSPSYEESEKNRAGNTGTLEIIDDETEEAKSPLRETSESNHSKRTNAPSRPEEPSERVTNHVANHKNNVVVVSHPKKDDFVSVDREILSSKCTQNESADDLERVTITSRISDVGTDEVDNEYRNRIARTDSDRAESNVTVNINSSQCNRLLLHKLKSKSFENSELSLKSATTRYKPNSTVDDAAAGPAAAAVAGAVARNNFNSECSVKNVPNGVSSTEKTRDNDDDIVILDEFPSPNKLPKTVTSATEIIDVDKFENNATKPSKNDRTTTIDLGSFARNMSRRPSNCNNQLSTLRTFSNLNARPPQSISARPPSLHVQRHRRIAPLQGYRSRPGQLVHSSTNRVQSQLDRRASHHTSQQQRVVQFNQTLHKRTTQTNEITFVQNNYGYAAKRTTMVQESVLQISSPAFMFASNTGFSSSTPLRDYNSPNSTLQSSHGLSRISRCTTQRTRARNTNSSTDEVVTLD